MAVKEYMFWFNYAILVLIAFIGFIIPFLLKSGILFGSRIPGEIINNSEFKNLKNHYKQAYLIINIPFLIAVGFLFYNSPQYGIYTAALFFQVILLFILYAVFNSRTKEIKKRLLAHEDIHLQKESIVIDTKFREGKLLVSLWWFLPSLIIIILNTIILLLLYDKIPNTIAMHYDINGTVTQLAQKSYLHVMIIPISSIITLLIFLGIHFLIRRSRQEIDSGSPEISKLKDRRFRYIWSGYLALVLFMLVTWSFFMSLTSNKLIPISGSTFEVINMVITFLILLGSIILAIKTGQSGSRLKFEAGTSESNLENVDDDKFWKFGMFYYNRADPSIFVEKRFGVGWTINFGHTWAMALAILLVVFIVIIHFLLKK